MSVFGKEMDLTKLVPKIRHFEQGIAFKPDYMQDVQQGTSDYYCYESTPEKESLPSNRTIAFKRCFACNKEGNSREHCSPKWIADRYKVKPLVANIFCKECNNWFGVNLENKMQQFLTTGCIDNKDGTLRLYTPCHWRRSSNRKKAYGDKVDDNSRYFGHSTRRPASSCGTRWPAARRL